MISTRQAVRFVNIITHPYAALQSNFMLKIIMISFIKQNIMGKKYNEKEN